MKLSDQLREYIQACSTGIWIESHEHQDALATIAELCRDEQWQLATWNVATGLQHTNGPDANSTEDPLTAIRCLSSMTTHDGTVLLVLENFHRFTGSAEIVQALAQQVQQGKHQRTFIIILSPVVQIPIELEKLFVVIEHELPDREQLLEIAQGIATEEGELPKGQHCDALLDASMGLTRYEAEAAFSLSLVREGRLTPATLWQQKSQMLKKSGLVSLHRGDEDFRQLGGLANLKAFCQRSLMRSNHRPSRESPRGVLMLGVPGTGKSAFAKALGNETNRPTLTLDLGALMGSLVGQTEQNIRQALKIADAMAPCILFADEIEKALSGATGNGQTDSGVSARMFGTLLSWMNDHTSDVYLVATCNDISKLPPEFSRAERFDAVVFLDLPGDEEKRAIWRLYLDGYCLDKAQTLPSDKQWTGAEIKACCRLARLLDVPLVQAAENVVPVAVTASESVERLRSWASGRCLSASEPGVYVHQPQTSKRRRKVSIDPSAN